MNMPPKQILVSIKTVFGKDVVLPVCPASVAFAQIAGSNTLSKQTITLIQSLGYNVKVKQDIKTLAGII